jgi:hypothetical protein
LNNDDFKIDWIITPGSYLRILKGLRPGLDLVFMELYNKKNDDEKIVEYWDSQPCLIITPKGIFRNPLRHRQLLDGLNKVFEGPNNMEDKNKGKYIVNEREQWKFNNKRRK